MSDESAFSTASCEDCFYYFCFKYSMESVIIMININIYLKYISKIQKERNSNQTTEIG